MGSVVSNCVNDAGQCHYLPSWEQRFPGEIDLIFVYQPRMWGKARHIAKPERHRKRTLSKVMYSFRY